jgi:hypothetical protein
MKNINWFFVMFAAIIAMIIGFVISLYGLDQDNHNTVIVGFVTVAAVCVSWWFWVMFVIRTMIRCTDKTTAGIQELKTGIHEVKTLLTKDKDFLSN